MEWQDIFDRVGEGFSKGIEGVNRGLLTVFGNANERAVRKLQPKIAEIAQLEPRYQALSDAELKESTAKFRKRLQDGETLDDILVEAFAACREAGRRFLRMRHFDVQMLGGMVLHSGKIAEMVTGEGKTLVATLPTFLNAIEGKGVHVITVNDYLARRDAEWMSPIYTGLGLTVGAIQSYMDSQERQHHYGCDVTYGTSNEFGFDYLRDNMKATKDLQCQHHLNFALIDEVDSILIDEARTPLIISGSATDDPTKYSRAHRVAMQLRREQHFEVKEKEHTCHLTDAGVLDAEKLVGVESFYTAGNMEWPHLIDNALKAIHLYRRDKDYIVRDDEIIIIDEQRGRAMEGRQWSDGLHQAVEAKEGVKIKEETQTLATITFQNFFKLYKKLGGMTGTAMTEANEFYKIYNLDVVAIPTNKPLIRENTPDLIFCTAKEKWKAVLEEVKVAAKTGRPILVGTTSIEKSELLSDMFSRNGIKHELLNAKNVEREADIVAQAGRIGQVTIATNMAGRGTDIILGGNPDARAWADLKKKYTSRLEVPPDEWRATMALYEDEMKQQGRVVAAIRPTVELAKTAKLSNPEKLAEIVDNATARERSNPAELAAKHGVDAEEIRELCNLHALARPGGLHIVGTERHESRRVDNQLRGRSGRQGDPGSSKFFLSLEDDLMRIFAGDWVRSILQRLGMKEGESIESRLVSRRIEAAQKKVEERNFETRKNLLEYDEIMDVQRKRVYGYRQSILEGGDCKSLIFDMIDHEIETSVKSFLAKDYAVKSFTAWASHRLSVELDSRDFLKLEFEAAEAEAMQKALREAESKIFDAIEDHLNSDVEQSEWNWEALTEFANRTWGLKLKSYDLKRMDREQLSEHIMEHATKALEQVNLSGGREFFDPNFRRNNLLGWANQKLASDLKLEDMPAGDEADTSQITAWLKRKARELYDLKEIEFPVSFGMNRYMAEKSNQGGSRYDREGLIEWANRRFDADLDIDDFRELTRSQVQQRLLEVSEQFRGKSIQTGDLEKVLDSVFPRDTFVPAAKLVPVSEWTEKHLGERLEFGEPMLERKEVRRRVLDAAERKFRPEIHEAERSLLLQFLDTGWKDHLYAMDHLKSGIGLVGYAQIDPKVEYKRKGKALFEEMWEAFERKVTELAYRVEEADASFVNHLWNISTTVHEDYTPQATAAGGEIRGQQDAAIEASKGDKKVDPIRNRGSRVGRNDPCPCGSGKKYKNCCMT